MCLGIPGRVVSVFSEGPARRAEIDVVGERRVVGIDFVPDVAVGDYVLAHLGNVMSTLSVEQAAETIRLMADTGLLEEFPSLDATLADLDAQIAQAASPEPAAPSSASCTTCSDEGREGVVLAAPSDPFSPARVRTECGEEDVDVTVVGPVSPGDVVLIHAGVAITALPAGSVERVTVEEPA
ncbi:MAG: HypC/HybG/HupF family hydrogenase formation chaperone [Mobilicoccus sp.]|nr:HypC/HybG/HupF family hydrogenase formation chaperone [Mobilicoccus sp.]